MKELGKWQAISFLSRGTAMAMGLIQSFVIIRILSVSDWGLIQLAVSIGGALGIYQHLGLASASTREISSAKDDSEVFKIFVTSIAVRYIVTFPIVLGLFFFADYIASDIYKHPQIAFPLRIYAISLFFQGFQSILNSVISGMKRFKQLFSYQVFISVISVVLYIPLVVYAKINGYFYAFLAFNIINTILLAIMAFRPLKGRIAFPDKKDFKRLFKEIFSISIGIYIVKIIYTNWEKLGGTLLGLYAPAEVLGLFAFAMLYSKKILTISDAVTDVNLPVLSEKFTKNFDEFKVLFVKNFDKVLLLILSSSLVATYWSNELVTLVVGNDKYDRAVQLIPFLVLAFVIYSILNIVTASVFIPAKMPKDMIIGFIVLMIGSLAFFFAGKNYLSNVANMAYSMVFGAALCLAYSAYSIHKKLNFMLISHDQVLLIVQTFFIGWAGVQIVGLNKIILFPVFITLFMLAIFNSNIMTLSEFNMIRQQLGKKLIKRNI